MKKQTLILLAVTAGAVVVGFVVGTGVGSKAEAGPSPIKALPEREAYYPGTEDLGPDEMRVVACGTGQPSVRPKQAAACWLVELCNGDKFIFDIGAQSMSRLSALNIPMDYLDKVFIGHLHTDHMGDLPIMWTGGRKMNRTVPLRIWGPSGETPELGIEAAMEGLEQFLLWDDRTLQGRLDARAWPWQAAPPPLGMTARRRLAQDDNERTNNSPTFDSHPMVGFNK